MLGDRAARGIGNGRYAKIANLAPLELCSTTGERHGLFVEPETKTAIAAKPLVLAFRLSRHSSFLQFLKTTNISRPRCCVWLNPA